MTARQRVHAMRPHADRALSWAKVLVPLFAAAFALRQSKEAKQDSDITAATVGGMVQRNASEARHHQVDDATLADLKRRVAALEREKIVGSRPRVARFADGPPQPSTPEAPGPGLIPSALGWLKRLVIGGK